MNSKSLRLIVFSIMLLIVFVLFYYGNLQNNPVTKIERLLENDIQTMSQNGLLHSGFNKLRFAKFYVADDSQTKWKSLKLPFKLQNKGEYSADIFIGPWLDDIPAKVVIQMSLIELSSGNFVTEISRTYLLEQNK